MNVLRSSRLTYVTSAVVVRVYSVLSQRTVFFVPSFDLRARTYALTKVVHDMLCYLFNTRARVRVILHLLGTHEHSFVRRLAKVSRRKFMHPCRVPKPNLADLIRACVHAPSCREFLCWWCHVSLCDPHNLSPGKIQHTVFLSFCEKNKKIKKNRELDG